MSYSESVFNQSLLYPCLITTANYLKKTSTCDPFFVPGEESLSAINLQLESIGAKVDHRKVYHADAVIRLHELFDLEVLLLETSGSFENKDERKISFDNVKDLFALLAMMETVADKFNYASADLFQKAKLYFIHASGK